MTTVWSPGANLSLNTIVAPTVNKRLAGMFFKVTSAGTTGSSEPNWPKTVGVTVYDNNVQYVSLSAVFSDLQPINPSAIIELFVLELNTALHGNNPGLPDSSETNVYRFHAGSNLNANGRIVFANKTYLRFPIEATGFAYQKGQIPRPKITISNAFGTISAILLTVNQTTAGNDLTGATVTRIRTMARFIDAVNFPSNSNPFGTPDPTAEFRRQKYLIDRKSAENREIVEFELAAPTDLAGVRLPKRQCTRVDFPGIGTFVQ